MDRQALFTARWHVANDRPIPAGPPKSAVLDLMEPILGPLSGSVPARPEPKPEAARPSAPAGPVQGRRPRVALVVGHNERQPGAWTLPPVGLSEFAYYSRMTEVLLELAKVEGADMEFARFFRRPSAHYAAEIDAAYRAVNAWDPDLVLELHFNGGGGNYAMMIAARGSERGVRAAAAVLRTTSEALRIPVWKNGSPAGVSQLSRGDRGGRSVWASSAPSVLTEPWFGDHSVHAARVAEVGFEGMARIHIEAARAALEAIR